MHTENFFINESGNWEAVEAVSESFPEFYAVSSLAWTLRPKNYSLTLIIEAIDSID